ncbi:hypothetical protein PPYR_02323 [Photinus pyralis]|uniref:Uncharacterized protein n=1 Tax=Photinus pyralis TaxID=7054 RepID=A0A5N4B734_PHOPY|nr:hypothetical protein PPYR_02323 [Photinus pyralis]
MLPAGLVQFQFVNTTEGVSKLIYHHQPRSLKTISAIVTLNQFKLRSFQHENLFGYIHLPESVLKFLKQLWQARTLKIICATEIYETLSNRGIYKTTLTQNFKKSYPSTLIVGINNTSVLNRTLTRKQYEEAAQVLEYTHPWITPHTPTSPSLSSTSSMPSSSGEDEQEDFRSIEMNELENEVDYKFRINRLVNRIELDKQSLRIYPQLELESLPYHRFYRHVNVDPTKIDLLQYQTYLDSCS